MLSSGVPIEVVADHLGHEDIQTTRKWYARILDTKMAEAVRKMEEFSPIQPQKKDFIVDSSTA